MPACLSHGIFEPFSEYVGRLVVEKLLEANNQGKQTMIKPLRECFES